MKLINIRNVILLAVITLSVLVCAANPAPAQTKPDYAILELPPLYREFGQAWKINNSTQIVGRCDTNIGGVRACLWEQDIVNARWIVTDLGTYADKNSEGWDINESGVVVGDASYNGADKHGFIWQNGNLEYDLTHIWW